MTGNPDNYYYTDDNGNLIQPGTAHDARPDEGLPDEDQGDRGNDRSPQPGFRQPLENRRAPPAAGDDFLDQATGQGGSRGGGPEGPRGVPPQSGPRPAGPPIGFQPPR